MLSRNCDQKKYDLMVCRIIWVCKIFSIEKKNQSWKIWKQQYKNVRRRNKSQTSKLHFLYIYFDKFRKYYPTQMIVRCTQHCFDKLWHVIFFHTLKIVLSSANSKTLVYSFVTLTKIRFFPENWVAIKIRIYYDIIKGQTSFAFFLLRSFSGRITYCVSNY